MKIKNLLAGMVLLGTSTFAGNIWAADWGPCQTENGQPYEYSFDFIQTISVPSENKAGTNLTSGYALTGTYQAGCECPDPIPNSIMTYFKGVSLLPEPGATKGYFKFNNNIDVLPAIYVLSHADLSVPFTDKGNRAPGKECLSNIESTTWTTGSKGNIKIAISHPFVGQLSIPRTPVAALYATKKMGVYNNLPLVVLNVSADITVTQGCELAAGTVLDIPFGEYQAHDFKGRAGQPPQNVQKIQKELSFDCNNISDGVKIYLSIDATPNNAYPSAIDLGNADVGAVIEDGKGNILKPNDSNSLLEMNPGSLYEDVKRKATTTITAYPVSTTGKLPAAGDYSGIATMHVELE
ncbi:MULTISPECIES: long polar fimbrial protein LpfD [unclassified Escherichia]|uniref:long polar fimbrial protein LpfD n=1 Tax=unclassified Escherichia TaxID=2608889 RepID=UPI00108115D2|nr:MULTISPECIES: long polar fimbrial protein LpfD [unclassified Escherichia]TGB75819.1 long polar fimbrial protein LpfD [Escherichia sp. E4694]TLJ02968.1 long polar fimbrial protein LpfD [Escherichia sp. E4385]